LKTDFLLDRLSDRGIRLRCFIYGLGLTVLAGTALLPTAAEAQSVWAGVGSGSSLTSDYKTGANWSTNPTAPIAGGSSAEFGSFGSTLVIVTAGAITPDSWQFDASAQAYTVTGAAVNFNTGTGLVNNAVGPISIANSLGGANAQLQQLGTGTLTLSGINT
jgi:hypothetical protein